jgi:Protein of unknown function (DUF2852)
MIDTSTSTADGQFRSTGRRCSGMFKKPWSVLEIGATVAGFVVFWPLGLAALALKYTKGEIWPGASEFNSTWKNKDWSQWQRPQGFSSQWRQHGSSGNAAFDDYRQKTLERLEAERRKLADEQRAFADHLAKLRMAKDKDEFDRFMSERNSVETKSE